MKIRICTNLGNGIGLEAEYLLLKAMLEKHGHVVEGVQFDGAVPPGTAGLAIFFEVFPHAMLGIARKIWFIPNPEWIHDSLEGPAIELLISRHADKILCKTRDAERLLAANFGNAVYAGFLTRDRYDPSILRERKFLHIAGNSSLRNSAAIISAWKEYRYWDSTPLPELTVVTNAEGVPHETIPGVTFIKRASDKEITRLMNSHLYHLYPSAYEGFGHAIHEGLLCNAVMLTTAAPPMDEFGCDFLVPSVSTWTKSLATLHRVHPQDVREGVSLMLASDENKMPSHRELILRDNAEFEERFMEELRYVPCGKITKDSRKSAIAILGNHTLSWCTERELDWTFGKLGHEVLRFQENADTTDAILEECLAKRVKLLIFVHTYTPNWEWSTPGTFGLEELWRRLRKAGVKIAGFHLDRYWGLLRMDGREARVGQHPFWTADKVFTADGGNEDRFRWRNVNHAWMPPAVVERDCHPGTFRKELASDIGFVGATVYHPEYPFRNELISALQYRYGDRFRLYTGYRGEALNDLYASIKVVVGDSCFGGSPYYWSDRVPETLGRHGFLVHPNTRGLDIPGLVTHEPGNIQNLFSKIDYFLAHEEERLACIKVASGWVKARETYTNRAKTILEAMGLR